MDKQQFQIVGIISWDKMLGYIQGWIYSTKGLPKICWLRKWLGSHRGCRRTGKAMPASDVGAAALVRPGPHVHGCRRLQVEEECWR